LITPADNPAKKVDKPRRPPSTRRAVADTRLAEIVQVAATTGDDPALDALILRLHIETACRRGGALALRPIDLDPDHCWISLREKGETTRSQPVSPTLMSHLIAHANDRGAEATPVGPLLRYRSGQRITRRRYDYIWTRIGQHLPWVAAKDQHALAAPHHSDLGRTQLRLRRRRRLRRTQRPRQRGRNHDDLRPGGCRGDRGGPHRTDPANHTPSLLLPNDEREHRHG
jgi:integrase